MSSSSATNSSLSSFSDECETNLPETSVQPPPHLHLASQSLSSINTITNECVGGRKPVHKVEPVFNSEANKIRVFLEDGSLGEYSLGELTTAEEVVGKMALRYSLGSDMRRYRLTLSEARDASWRSIRYIRPQKKLKEVAQWPCISATTICTLRVVIVPSQAEILADIEPITFTYLYRQSINDFVRERAGSEISVDIAVQLTALLILDEALCTGTRANVLVKRSWLFKQLLPRSLLDQFSLKQLIHRVRDHLQHTHNITQMIVARQFITIFSENTRSFAGKLFPVKFPDKHRDSILLVGPRHPIAIVDQTRRLNSPAITLVSAWSHLSRVIVKQYRNGVAVRLITTPRTTTTLDDVSLLQQEISFLIHTNLLNDLMAFIEGYSQLEASNVPLAIERISHISKSTPYMSNRSQSIKSSTENPSESSCRSPFVQRILSNKKYHQTYSLTNPKPTPPASPSLFEITRQFFTRNPTKVMDADEHETVSNVPNRTTLVTWRTIADTHATTPPPAPVLYRTVIDVKKPGQIAQTSDDDDDDEAPDVIDLTTSYGYYGCLSFPVRPPSPFADGLVWSEMTEPRNEYDDGDEDAEEDTGGVVVWSPSTKQLSIHYNSNNNNNNVPSPSPTSTSSRMGGTWKRTLDRILRRAKLRKDPVMKMYDFDAMEDSMMSRHQSKHVHWVDDHETILQACHRFVEHLKIFVQNVVLDKNEEIHLKNCQKSLAELHMLTDCSELQRAFEETIQLARKQQKTELLQQQTILAHLISRTVLPS
ncbi:unnamed protein product [Adineta ricciae]|uniref:FERM domain-containing protein n=1 Tax=Adineta ricciae TaxID=249248 RepID=A0A814FK04_ADIRI|nr:unnamed protein product [Adineta ricciae]